MYREGDVVALLGSDARKIVLVLRKRAGERVEVCDSAGRSFPAILEIDGSNVSARLGSGSVRPAPKLEIVLAQGLPKAQKMDFVVEKATELGVQRIVPVRTERTIAGGERAGKLERWRRIARAAAAQCGRSDVPVVADVIDFPELENEIRSAPLALIPWELAERASLRDVLPGLLEGVARVVVAIGPEGGFAHDEIEQARSWGARALSLGKRILRTETAGLVACSVILYAAGEL